MTQQRPQRGNAFPTCRRGFRCRLRSDVVALALGAAALASPAVASNEIWLRWTQPQLEQVATWNVWYGTGAELLPSVLQVTEPQAIVTDLECRAYWFAITAVGHNGSESSRQTQLVGGGPITGFPTRPYPESTGREDCRVPLPPQNVEIVTPADGSGE